MLGDPSFSSTIFLVAGWLVRLTISCLTFLLTRLVIKIYHRDIASARHGTGVAGR